MKHYAKSRQRRAWIWLWVALWVVPLCAGSGWAAPPVISLTGDFINGDFSEFSHIRQAVTMTFDLTVTDFDNDTATIGASNLPAGAGFVDNGDNTARLTWKPGPGQGGFYTVYFSANDGTSLVSDSELFLVTAYPLSHGYYRFPYADGTVVRVSRDHDTHTPVIKMDMRGTPEFTINPSSGDTIAGEYQIVSGADGQVMETVDDNTSCCTGCSGCNNHVRLKHRNGEWSKYTHFETGTVTGPTWANLDSSDTVPIPVNTYLGEEGDVGATSGGLGTFNRPQGTCGSGGGDTTKLCGVHLHFECRVDSSNSDLRIPMICGISDNILNAGDTITAGGCPTGGCPLDTFILPMATVDTNDILVIQANDRVTTEFAGFFTVQGTSSVNFNAGGSITLAPGFSARRHTYFHAWIGPCNSPPGGPPTRVTTAEEANTPELSRDVAYNPLE